MGLCLGIQQFKLLALPGADLMLRIILIISDRLIVVFIFTIAALLFWVTFVWPKVKEEFLLVVFGLQRNLLRCLQVY